jgi:plasmid stabilization system protein ParE
VTDAVAFQPAARNDLTSAASWYADQRDGLDDEFMVEFQEAVSRIVAMPLMRAKLCSDIRREPLRRFPYGVFYVVRDSQVIIVAVMHNNRAPSVWQERNA